MFNSPSSRFRQILQNVALVWLSLALLPLTAFVTVLAYSSNLLIPSSVTHERKARRKEQSFKEKTILVTGVGMNKGLTIARLFYESGHIVVGAEFESGGALACGRVSKALTKFYQLQRPHPKLGSGPYIGSLIDIISKEHIDLWVSCSGVASAIEDGEAKEAIEKQTSCKAIQFDVATTQLLHEKHTFIEQVQRNGLVVPETHTISNAGAAEAILRNAGDRRYIMKPIGMDDANRGDMTLLPRPTTVETEAHLFKLRISEESPWILQQFVQGPEYCTHALVIKGVVKAFVACPSAELLMHYEALPPDSRLSEQMLEFTIEFAGRQGSSFTGHLSFDFLLDSARQDSSDDLQNASKETLYPIECNPRAHTAVVLFNDTSEMANAYLSLIQTSTSGLGDAATSDNPYTLVAPVTPLRSDKYYWIGHDFVTRLLVPVLSLLTLQPQSSIAQVMWNLVSLLQHILFWRDGTFERWDPLPWWWLYHVYWPMQLLNALWSGTKWSRINVSTTKMFVC